MGGDRSEVHEMAARGFEQEAEAYERARPSYPAEAVVHLIAALGTRPGSLVVDVGAGTGKLTRLLAPFGARLVAVDPVDAMRRQFAAAQPAIPVIGGTAEHLPLRSRIADAIVIAQAFHWLDHARALAEIHRVLRPGGGLAVLWNTRDPSTDWTRAFAEIIDPYQQRAPSERDAAARLEASELFDGPQHRPFSYVHRLTPDDVVTRVISASYVATLPDAERADVLNRVRRLVETHPDTLGRPEVQMPYVTDVYVSRAR